MCDQRGPHPVAASPGALPPWFVVAAVGTWLGLAAPLTRSRSLPPGSLQQVVMEPCPRLALGEGSLAAGGSHLLVLRSAARDDVAEPAGADPAG